MAARFFRNTGCDSLAWIVTAGLVAACGSGSKPAKSACAAKAVCPASTAPAPIPITASGWVSPDSTPYCIQGEWTWAVDAGTSGKSTFTGLAEHRPPYVAGSGMCLSGSSPGGAADGYHTWGGNIRLTLNQSAPGQDGNPLSPAPRCFTIAITGTAPGGLTASLCPAAASGWGVICPQKPLSAGINEVCVDDVEPPSYCGKAANVTCIDKSQLAHGIASVVIQGNAGDTGGPIDFCVASISAHGVCADGGTPGTDAGPTAVSLPAIAQGQIDARAFGRTDLSAMAFAAFSQLPTNQSDPQVLELAPDIVVRAWARWDRWGLKSSDYDFEYAAACRAKGIDFVGGTTASVLFPDEVSGADFQDEVSRDAEGNPVSHPELAGLEANAHRATLASPGYRQRLVDIGEIQIDGGVDGLHFDEVLGGYTGANWTGGDEGFDDHHVADFGEYLCRKYAGAPSRLAAFGVNDADRLDCTGPGRGRTFDYRGYLARRGAQKSPLSASLNPLAPDWGSTTNNRPDPSKGTFLETIPSLVYWQQIVVALREYARSKYHREILVSANGVFPFADFQTVGLYDGNIDGPNGANFDWVPVNSGHLAGTTSFVAALRGLKQRSKRITDLVGGKEVPVVVFLDWPTGSIDRYYALPLQERKDYFRLYAYETQALGMLFALPLATTTDTHTATALGMMDFFEQLRSFYRSHAELYRGASELSDVPTVSAPDTVTLLTRLADGRTVLHLVNHAYSAGVIAQHGVSVRFPVAIAPTSVILASPDFTADKTASFTYAGGNVSVDVGDLGASVAVVVK